MNQIPSKFSKLSPRQKNAVAQKFLKVLAMAGGKYESVEGETSMQQAPGFIEYGTKGEDSVLSGLLRNKITNQVRNQLRNSPIARIIDQQRRANIVGQVGGNLIINFPKGFEASAEECETWFNQDWAPTAEFTDGLHLNDLLKNTLSASDTSGDNVLLFDDGVLDNSGRIRAFESDEIANLKDGDFRARFGTDTEGYTQSQGRIYDVMGRFCGVIVSAFQRGRSEFDADKAFVLTMDPRADRRDAFWCMPRHIWRLNQGRGVSPMSASIRTMMNAHDIIGSETQAAKLNAKLVGQILDSADQEEKSKVPNEFAPGETDPSEESESSLESSGDRENQPELTFDDLDSIGAMYDIMPPKLKMELFDTKRPNDKLPEFINFLVGMSGGVYGFARPFATLDPIQSYAGFKACQALTRPSIEEGQKQQERYILDWIARNAFRWAVKNNMLKKALPPNWMNCRTWEWPELPEVNEVDAQNAIEKGLTNGTMTYQETLGKGSKKKIQRVIEEVKFFDDNGLVHPMRKTVSGQVIDSASQKSNAQTADENAQKEGTQK
jgi:hypothetical protein